MTTSRGTIALLGLPRTGKSTYLGSLWQLVQDAGDASIEEVDLSGDRSHLQSLGEQVAAANEISRTEVDSDEGLRLTVRFQQSGGQVTLDVPDISGETSRSLVEDRFWHPNLLGVVERAEALLVFVHPDQLQGPIRAAFTADILAQYLERHTSEVNAAVDASGRVQEDSMRGETEPRFASRMACTASKLIDLMENILAIGSAPPARIGIVVSAWDVVDGTPSPDEWLGRELPAFMSFLRSQEGTAIASFGVSAQGGKLPKDRDELLKKGGVLQRSYARDASGEPVPISRPIEWALFG
jgi:hypothetical protein